MKIDDPIGKWLLTIIKKYRDFLKEEFLKLGFNLNPREGNILLYLYRNGDGKSQEEIAELVGVNKATISRSIGDLVETGLLERRISPLNKSMYNIYLTEEAKNIEPEIKNTYYSWLSYLTKDIEQEKIQCFTEILKKMFENLENPAF